MSVPVVRGITLTTKKAVSWFRLRANEFRDLDRQGIKKTDAGRLWDLRVLPHALEFSTRDGQNFKLIPRSQIQALRFALYRSLSAAAPPLVDDVSVVLD